MKVIGVGFGRTGTLSLKVALEELGVGPCLHTLESLAAGSDCGSHWERIANGETIEWSEALQGWGSTVDLLGARFYHEMLEAWPQAKVILSTRDPDEWYESCNASLHAMRELTAAGSGRASGSAALQAIDKTIWQDVFDGRFLDRAYALEVFQAHADEVASTVPAERLLVYDIRDGWEPLCEFLQTAVPDTSFPHLNGRRAFWARVGEPATAARSARRGEQLPRIAGLALAAPGRSLDQHEVLSALGLSDDEFARRVFGRCGVQRRRLDLVPELLRTPMQARTDAVERQLLGYATEAVRALAVDPSEIGTVVTSSLYSLGCPTLAHRLVEHLELDRATDKYHIVGVGCASAVPLVRLLTGSLRNDPGGKGLIVAAESMSGLLMATNEGDQRSKIVGWSIFGDGGAAMLLDNSPDAEGPAVMATRVCQLEGTLDAVTFRIAVDDSYLQMVRELPDLAGANLRSVVDQFLRDNSLTGHMIDHWLLHPGGRRIIETAQAALSLSDEDVSVSVDTLADHGNVGTPTIFYVLQRMLEQRRPGPEELGLVVTIGPGVSVGLMLLRF